MGWFDETIVDVFKAWTYQVMWGDFRSLTPKDIIEGKGSRTFNAWEEALAFAQEMARREGKRVYIGKNPDILRLPQAWAGASQRVKNHLYCVHLDGRVEQQT